MNIGTITAKIENHREEIRKCIATVKEYMVSDEPLEDRWNAFLCIEDSLPTAYCYLDLDLASKEFGRELEYYDDLNMDRYKVEKCSAILSRIKRLYLKECGKVDPGSSHDDYVKLSAKHGLTFDKFRNHIMKSGFGSIMNDW